MEARDLVKRFGGLQAVAGMSIALAPGEMVGLIGPNGAGKTTLFNLLAGAFRPTSARSASARRTSPARAPSRASPAASAAPSRSRAPSPR